jgi:hypothetical protein
MVNQLVGRPVSPILSAALLIVLATPLAAQAPHPTRPAIPADDMVRIREFYRLAATIQDRIWPHWSATPAPLLLVTEKTEFLFRHPAPPPGFEKVGDDLWARPRTFPTNLLATFPAFGPPAVIVIGEPAETGAKSSTVWLFVVLHEHFHQLQDAQPGYFKATEELGLARGDTSGMWMLNYPFPYRDSAIGRAFAKLRDALLAALRAPDPAALASLAATYKAKRAAFLARLAPDDRKYLSFQLWQEGIARYTQVVAAEKAAGYRPSAEFAALSDFEPFAVLAHNARAQVLQALARVDLATAGRGAVYPLGCAEGLLLDRIDPHWKDSYFRHPFTLDPYFR